MVDDVVGAETVVVVVAVVDAVVLAPALCCSYENIHFIY